MHTPIQLIVGLGNPGQEYTATRHNAGAWLVTAVAESCQHNLRLENKFKGHHSRVEIAGQECHLLIPATFMNLSGQAVGAVAKFYKINPENILIAHDDLDLPCGTVRLKFDGGHGGHNGLRDIIAHLNTPKFYRLRIGIGHPGKGNDVVNYVLQPPRRAEKELIDVAIQNTLAVLPEIVSGQIQKAMKELHTSETAPGAK